MRQRISRSAIVEQPARLLYDLVEDIESYPRFLPWCREATVHTRDPGHTRATLAVGLHGIRHRFTTDNTNRPGEGIEMKLVEGPFRQFAATWRFLPLAEDAARVEFTMEYEFANRIVARLLSPLFAHIADTMLDAFLRRADTLHGKSAR